MAEYRKRSDSLSNKEQDALKDMRIVQEMYARGFAFEPIDIFKAHSRPHLPLATVPFRTASIILKDSSESSPIPIRYVIISSRVQIAGYWRM